MKLGQNNPLNDNRVNDYFNSKESNSNEINILKFSSKEDSSNNEYNNKDIQVKNHNNLSCPTRLKNDINNNFSNSNNNIKKINNSSIQFKNFNDNKELNENEYNENTNFNDSNILNYNYLENEKIDNIEEDENFGNKTPEEIICDLKSENRELRNDMKKLYFLTQENKKNLIEHIQILKDENYRLKNEKKELEYRLLINEGKNNELKADNEKIITENKIIQQKYLNEIKELNCQLNNYKIKLNNLTLNYDQLLNDFHYSKKEKIFQMSEPLDATIFQNKNGENHAKKNNIYSASD